MDTITKIHNRLTSKFFGEALHKWLSEQYPKEYGQYLRLRGKKNKTKSQQQRCRSLWNKIYRNNKKMKSLIHQEYLYALKLSNRSLMNGALNR